MARYAAETRCAGRCTDTHGTVEPHCLSRIKKTGVEITRIACAVVIRPVSREPDPELERQPRGHLPCVLRIPGYIVVGVIRIRRGAHLRVGSVNSEQFVCERIRL